MQLVAEVGCRYIGLRIGRQIFPSMCPRQPCDCLVFSWAVDLPSIPHESTVDIEYGPLERAGCQEEDELSQHGSSNVLLGSYINVPDDLFGSPY